MPLGSERHDTGCWCNYAVADGMPLKREEPNEKWWARKGEKSYGELKKKEHETMAS